MTTKDAPHNTDAPQGECDATHSKGDRTMPLKDAALRYHDAGLTVLPNDPHLKYPHLRNWQNAAPTRHEVAHWFSTNQKAIGLRCGPQNDGSNIEGIDIDSKNSLPDDPDLYDAYAALVEALAPGLLQRLPLERTPTGGYHIPYKCSVVAGNLKLAERPTTSDELDAHPKRRAVTLIETRGTGGQFQVAPSPGYTMIRGDWANLPEITPAERQVLLDSARALHRLNLEKTHGTSTGERPGDAYNADPASADEALRTLERNGWKPVYSRGDVTYLARPGKKHGISASFGHVAPGVLYVFSTSAHPFQDATAYRPFAILALLDHNGDYQAAAKELATRGYGAAPGNPPTERDTAQPGDENLTDLGNARRLCRFFGQDIRYIHAWGKWLCYDGTAWRMDETGAIHRLARETVRMMYTEAAQLDGAARTNLAKHAIKSERASSLAAMVSLARSEPGVAIRHEDLDTHPFLLNCTNGTVDLRTGTLRPHSRADLLTRCLDIDYDPTAQAPTWTRFIATITADNAPLAAFLQRAIGYTLTGDVTEQCVFFLHGNGQNGKSTLMEALGNLLRGYWNKAPNEMIMLQRGGAGIPNDIARLPGSRMCSTTEIPEGRRLDESKIKDLTGGDTIPARFMRGEWFSFKPTFKLWLYGNHKPIIKGTDHGIWRRIRLIPLTVQIPDHEKDPRLLEKFQKEHAGILAWAVRGCLAWQKHGLTPPDVVTHATAAYREEMDSIGAFLTECCIEAPNAQVSAKALYDAYKEWALESGEQTVTQKRLGERLKMRGYDNTARGSNGRTIWTGVGLRTKPEPSEPSEPLVAITLTRKNDVSFMLNHGSDGSDGSRPTVPGTDRPGMKASREEPDDAPPEPEPPSDAAPPAAQPDDTNHHRAADAQQTSAPTAQLDAAIDAGDIATARRLLGRLAATADRRTFQYYRQRVEEQGQEATQ